MDIESVKGIIKKGKNGIIGEDTEYTKYSVLIPLVEIEGHLNILLEVRSKKMRSQPGEISFPGGKVVENEDYLNAAVRESCEEIGISRNDIEIFGPSGILITQHYKIIYAYAGCIKSNSCFNISKDEVDHIFFVPLEFFVDNAPVIKKIRIVTEPEEKFPYENLEGAGRYKWITGKNEVYFYKYNNYVIWGITAKIINNFIKIISGRI